MKKTCILLALLTLLPVGAQEEEPGKEPGKERHRSRFGGPTQGVLHTGKEEEEGFGLGSILPDPTAFQGANRIDPVLQGSRFVDNLSLTGYYSTLLSENQRLLFTAAGGLGLMSLDVDYSFIPEGTPGYFTLNLNHTQSQTGSFLSGTRVGLPPNNDDIWLRRTNAGFGYSTDPNQDFSLSTALLYERINVTDGPFAARFAPFDTFGNPILFNPAGTDERLLLRASGLYMDLDDIQFPTEGRKLRFYADQSMPLTAVATGSSRLALNHAEFVKLGDDVGAVFNVQGGTTIGTPAPYDAYNLGGQNSIRGYALGEVGGGSKFLQGTAELRWRVGEISVFGSEIPIRLTSFVDYGSGLGTANEVFGQPAVARNKPDSGLGYGVGVQAITNYGLMRLEAGFGAQSRSAIYFSLGDRF